MYTIPRGGMLAGPVMRATVSEPRKLADAARGFRRMALEEPDPKLRRHCWRMFFRFARRALEGRRPSGLAVHYADFGPPPRRPRIIRVRGTDGRPQYLGRRPFDGLAGLEDMSLEQAHARLIHKGFRPLMDRCESRC